MIVIAEMPIAMLRTQKKVRSLSATTAWRACARILISLFIDDDPVLDPDDPVRVGRDRRVMGDDDDGFPPLVHSNEEIHDLRSRPTVELARRLAGPKGCRVVHQRPADGHPLLLPSGE